MRILIIGSQFRFIGGIAEVVHNLALQFVERGYEVVLAAISSVVPGFDPVSRDGIQPLIVRIPPTRPLSWRHLERLLPNRGYRELAEFIRKQEPDVVNCHLNDWDRIPTVVRACRTANAPLVHTFYDRYSPGKLGTKALAPLKFAAALTTLSAAARRDWEQLDPALGRALVIRLGVDARAAREAEPFRRARPYVFCAARLDLRGKAIDVLISSFRIIAAQHPEVDLLIAGSGPHAGQLERQVGEAGLRERVAFLGAVARSELWKLYKGALFFAMPSRRPEAMGLVFLESMACGRPVIGTRSGGVPEIVSEGETGLLVERNEPAELAQAMRTMLADADRREAMGRRGQQLAAQYDWSVAAESYLRLYRSCLKERRNR